MKLYTNERKSDAVTIRIVVIVMTLMMILIAITALTSPFHTSEATDPCVGVKPGSCNTQIWYHDKNGDGVADYKTTYAVVEGKLTMLKKEILKPDEFVSPINPK